MSTLADAIIEVGPFAAGEEMGGLGMALHASADLNELRDELIELRRLKAAAEARQRFQVSAVGGARTVVSGIYPDTAIWLECGRCTWSWAADLNHSANLADLNRRATEHTEVCR